MPTRVQSDVEPAGQMLAVLELERIWGECEGDPLNGDEPTHERQAVQANPLCQEIEFEAIRDAPGAARRKLIAALQSRGHDDALIQDAALVLTELAANAVVHVGSSFSVCVSLRGSTLRIEVADRGTMITGRAGQAWVPRQARGLGLIDAVCTRWGTDMTATGKVVWGELRL
ncbi:MAG: ATP-binding protein [Solirubrobacteraceae bacterium]